MRGRRPEPATASRLDPALVHSTVEIRRPVNRHQPGDRPASVGDHDLAARGHAAQVLRQLRLELADADFHVVTIPDDVTTLSWARLRPRRPLSGRLGSVIRFARNLPADDDSYGSDVALHDGRGRSGAEEHSPDGSDVLIITGPPGAGKSTATRDMPEPSCPTPASGAGAWPPPAQRNRPIRHMWQQFADLGRHEHHVIDTSRRSENETVRAVEEARTDGRLRLDLRAGDQDRDQLMHDDQLTSARRVEDVLLLGPRSRRYSDPTAPDGQGNHDP